MGNNLLWSALLYFIQPLFLVGLLYVIVTHRKRVSYMRKQFRVNFVRENFEVKEFFLKGIIPGVLLSIVTVLVGVPISIEWYITYQIVALFFLLIGGYRLIHPLFTFTMTSIVLYALDVLNIEQPFTRLDQLIQQSTYTFQLSTLNVPHLTTNIMLLTSIVLLISIYLLNNKEAYKLYPMLRASKRGKTVAKYQNKSLWALPLLVVVPGDVFGGFADWWPLFDINGQSYAFLFMPILVGFHFTVSTQLVNEATAQIQKEFRNIALIGILFLIISYIIPTVSILGTIILFVSGIVVLIRHRRRENQWGFRYGPANEGLRIIAVRSNSPSERMDLSIGDIILEINDQDMVDLEAYNKVLATSRSYIKMRIKRTDGEIMITQTPLYDNDYNNLGLLILEN